MCALRVYWSSTPVQYSTYAVSERGVRLRVSIREGGVDEYEVLLGAFEPSDAPHEAPLLDAHLAERL